MAVLRVVKWEEFQHYRDRDPVWIKLHRGLMDNYEWSRLQDASKSHLIGIWLLAARHNNEVPADPEWIGARISATDAVDLQVLVRAGFIAIDGEVEQDASDTLATCYARGEREERREEKKKPASPVASGSPNWPAEVAAALALVGPVTPGRVGKQLAPLFRDNPYLATHGAPLLVRAAEAYARHVGRMSQEEARRLKHPHDFISRAGFWVDQVRPGGLVELVDGAA